MSLGTDLTRYFRGIVPRVAVITVIVMPLLYGAMYLWAFWDPFAQVSKVPVALVNEDRGAQAQGEPLRAGDEVARALIDSGQLKLTETSAPQAADGVASGEYYFAIMLPQDFSARIASPSAGDPQQAQIRFLFNDANNYTATLAGQNASREVLNQVNAKIGERSVRVVLTGLTDAGDGLRQAADGADQLAAGLSIAGDGTRQLAGGADTVASALDKARVGTAQLAVGTRELSKAVDATTGPLLEMLDRVDGRSDPTDLAIPAQHLSGAVRSTTDRIAAMNVDKAHAAAIVDQAIGLLHTNPDPAVRSATHALAGAHRLLREESMDPTTDEGLIRLRDSAARLENDFGDPDSELRDLLARTLDGGLRADVAKLRDGVGVLNSGAQQLTSGMAQLADGGHRLADGAGQLADGAERLREGGQELATKLREGSTMVPSWTPQHRTDVARTLAAPVGLDLVNTNPASTFGTGFAPFFLPLALFIGASFIWMLLTPLQSRPIVDGLGALRVVLASYWPGLLVAACQVAVLYTVVRYGLGLKPESPLGVCAFLMLVAGAFLAVTQAFNAVFGVAVGRVVTLAFLMIQLVSAGGVHPVETTAKPFQIIHPFNPMTHAVNGLRQLTVGGIDSRLWMAVAVLAGLLAASLAVSAWAARRNRQYTMTRLHPPVKV